MLPTHLTARLRCFSRARRIHLLVPPTGVMNVSPPTRRPRKSEMTTYTIDTENSITAHASQQELASLVAEWPANRLIEVWNGIPGLTPVKKFKDQKSAVSRIWKAIQSL